MLASVDTGLERSRPAGGVHRSSFVLGTPDRLPVHKEGDGVLGPWHTAVRLACCNTRGSAGNYASRNGKVLEDPTADIDVVR